MKFVLCYKWWNNFLKFKINKLSGQTKLFVMLFKWGQLVKLKLALIKENWNIEPNIFYF